ncbi:hypothetical protein [Rosenbergiella epipactidis]|uniref:hypothetical protein n=1 Tax=Rosenbergiella epipactidis TaxID=1544694 RepID=UPI001F4D35DA|nr:hypothetical protein [Rosenbergiella epipactidis]
MESNDHFIKFPYRKEVRDNGDINNGGIDLVLEPQRISEIHEINGFTWLKRFIQTINSENGFFMTFGCVAGREEKIVGYIDFSVRPQATSSLRTYVHNLESLFYSYLHESMSNMGQENPQQATDYAKMSLIWEETPLEIYGQTYSKLTVIFQVVSEDAAEWIFSHLEYFLSEYFPSLPHVKAQRPVQM